MKLTEKASYIKGLADGLELNKDTKEGKLIAALIDLVDAMSQKIDEMDHDIEDLNDYCEELDEDLGDVEEVLLGEDDDEDEEEACDGECEKCDYADDCEYADADEETYEIECPSCGEKVCFDASVDPENLTCPACGEKFSCKFDEDDKK